METAVTWIWWAAQWPVLVVVLLLVFAGMLYVGLKVDHPRWQFVPPRSRLRGRRLARRLGLVAFYLSNLGSYNQASGIACSPVIVHGLHVAVALGPGASDRQQSSNAEARRGRSSPRRAAETELQRRPGHRQFLF